MMHVILSGAKGAMGRTLQEVIDNTPDIEYVAGIDQEEDFSGAVPVYGRLRDVKEEADLVIDFSHYSAFDALLSDLLEKNMPAVIATTGLSDSQKEAMVKASEILPLFHSANMSLGINLIAKLLKEVVPVLEESFDIEISERHHNKKKDAPSGTALLLADAINEGLESPMHLKCAREGVEAARAPREIGISAQRGGTIPGEHTVLFAGEDELIEFKHTALSKKIFASGALRAARFLTEKGPGLYNMNHVIG